MAYGEPLGAVLPTVGVTEGPEYATEINAFLGALQDVVEAPVTPAGLDINEDLSFQSGTSKNGAVDIGRIEFENKTSLLAAATYPSNVYVKSGELYYNDAAGNQVQLTLAGSINASLLGGITGAGYGSGGVVVNWDSVNQAYQFRTGTGTNDYANTWMKTVQIQDGSGNFATISASGMAADYTVILPTALPGAGTNLMLLSSAGQMSTTLTPTVTSLTTTGTLSIGTTSTFTGLITASAGLTAAANQSITVSGTGKFKHGSRTIFVPAIKGHARTSSASDYNYGPNVAVNSGTVHGRVIFNTGSIHWRVPIELPGGARITACAVAFDGIGAGTKRFNLFAEDYTAATTATGQCNITSDTSAGQTFLDMDLATPYTVGAASEYLFFQFDSAANGDMLSGFTVTYDVP